MRAHPPGPWRRAANGDWIACDGAWRIRGPMMGRRMYWLYRNGTRVTPTGRFEDAVSFTTSSAAKGYVRAAIEKATEP